MPGELKKYDLVVIGGGPAGIIGAATAVAFGRTVALIDNHHALGGAGINTGTVPSKTLRETALALSGMKTRDLYGVDLSLKREATVADFLRHEQSVTRAFDAMISQQFETYKTDTYCGTGSFVDPHTIQILMKDKKMSGESEKNGIQVYGEKILIATGSTPFRPPLFPWDKPEIYDSDTILQLDKIPKVMGVIGAGMIGSEYACTFDALGGKVHIIDNKDTLLPFLDEEVVQTLVNTMTKNGILFHWNEQVVKCTSNKKGVHLKFFSGGGLTVDAVLVAAGRKSNTDSLNLANGGVSVGNRGLIPVNDKFQTNIPHIYAAGDVIGFPALASTSMDQARKAVYFALGLGMRVESVSLLPFGVYTIPEIGMVGETEQSLKQKGIPYIVGKALYKNNARGRIIGDESGFLKLLFRKEDMKLLGAHVLGEHATDLVHIGLMAMLSNSSIDLFIEACFNFPTLSGLYKSAAYDAILRSTKNGRALPLFEEA